MLGRDPLIYGNKDSSFIFSLSLCIGFHSNKLKAKNPSLGSQSKKAIGHKRGPLVCNTTTLHSFLCSAFMAISNNVPPPLQQVYSNYYWLCFLGHALA
ncbi:hypothetical protein RJT34_12847 [Clitoria ternatea]|uniref:Uncharacterized protein n=1 Tax=Clitoria ternatea TaxID=43366 RepID=A0AAN9PJQ7_CLITE